MSLFHRFVVSLLALAGVASASHAAPFLFGVADGGNLYSIDIAAKQSSLLYTETATATFAQPNALAFDASSNNLYYRAAQSGDLYSYSLATGVRSSSILSAVTLGGVTSNAAFYSGSYWAIRDNSSTLVRVSNLGTTPTVTTFSLGTGAPGSLSFGDIAITTGGVLYGHTSNSIFFSANISTLASATSGSATDYRSDNTGNLSSVQIAFDPTDTVLYGHNFAATGANDRWYTVNNTSATTTFGDATAITGWNDALAYRDIAGSAAVIPESGTLALLGAGTLFGVMATGIKRRKR